MVLRQKIVKKYISNSNLFYCINVSLKITCVKEMAKSVCDIRRSKSLTACDRLTSERDQILDVIRLQEAVVDYQQTKLRNCDRKIVEINDTERLSQELQLWKDILCQQQEMRRSMATLLCLRQQIGSELRVRMPARPGTVSSAEIVNQNNQRLETLV